MLRMARTEEKRTRIKWFHARSVFFGTDASSLSDGLAFARDCDHEDARCLASLFPGSAPATKEEAAAVFLTHPDDARCLCWASWLDAEPRVELMQRAADMGYAWAQYKLDVFLVGKDCDLLEKAAAQGDPDAMSRLAAVLCSGCRSPEIDMSRARLLWLEAAKLGNHDAQFNYSIYGCVPHTPEHLEWLRRAGVGKDTAFHVWYLLSFSVREDLKLFDDGGSGRRVFETGGALAVIKGWRKNPQDAEITTACERAVSLFEQWCAEARRTILCWLWIAKRLDVSKDIRLLIADLLWDQRAAWSERERSSTDWQRKIADRLLKVHTDILRMAETEEKRDRIKWFHARRAFFERRMRIEGLALARQCMHEDARLLVSIFPDGVAKLQHASTALAKIFLAQSGGDMRCLCWTACCDGDFFYSLMEQSAKGGCAWAQASYASVLGAFPDQRIFWYEKAAAQGEREAMVWIGENLMEEYKSDKDEKKKLKAQALFREAAELGDDMGQFLYATHGCVKDSAEQYAWMRRSAIQNNCDAVSYFSEVAAQQVELYYRGASGRLLFEIGAALAAEGGQDWWNIDYADQKRIKTLYQECCSDAVKGIMCWLWLAQKLDVSKDIRVMIADLVWDERAAWSEQKM